MIRAVRRSLNPALDRRSRDHLMTKRWLGLVFLLATIGAAATAQSSPWYQRTRQIDLTGANSRDSVVLVAHGTRPESLLVTLTFYVGGSVAHEEKWRSDYEMVDLDVADTVPRGVTRFMQASFDSIIGWVKRERLDTVAREDLRLMGDSLALKSLPQRPTHWVTFGYGYETAVFMVWYAQRRRLVVVMTCC
jgi:hypothetical protein